MFGGVEGASSSLEIQVLKEGIFWFCLVLGGAVVLVLLVSVLYHHYGLARAQSDTKHTLLREVFWLAVAGVMMFAMALPASQIIYEQYIDDTPRFDGNTSNIE
jgi:heme/copper-type cytochrome/quinol oxidase subunit 2